MKKKLTKIFGIGLSLVLVLAMAGPLMADVSEPEVSLARGTDDIDIAGDYTIIFDIGAQLTTGDTITVRFPDDTTVPEGATVLAKTTDFLISAGEGVYEGEMIDGVLISIATADGDEDDRTVTFMLGGGDFVGKGAMVVINFLAAQIINPTEAGDYTLQVRTSEETDWVESEVYEIGVPTVGGGVTVYNKSDVQVNFYGGATALNDAIDEYGDNKDYTIEVGPGTYDLDDGTLNISGEGLTLESTDGVEETIIDASSANPGINITADDVTVDGFTVEDALGDGIVIKYDTEGVTVKNNIFIDAGWSGVALSYDQTYPTWFVTEATVSGNVFEDCGAGIDFGGCALDCTISDNTITGCGERGISFNGGTADNPTKGNTITGNTTTPASSSASSFLALAAAL